MSMDGIPFTLPIGFMDSKDQLQRSGAMRLVTAGDELAIQGEEKIAFNPRYRDLYLLARVITRLGEKETIEIEDLENLYEADFLYLQLFFHSINRDEGSQTKIPCPYCGATSLLPMSDLFKNMMLRPAAGEEDIVSTATMLEAEGLS